MHYPRVPEEAFRGHTIVHHGLYKGDDSYFVPEGEHPEHILLKRYALPAIVLVHLPILLLVEKFIAPHTAVGGTVAMTLYFVIAVRPFREVIGRETFSPADARQLNRWRPNKGRATGARRAAKRQ